MGSFGPTFEDRRDAGRRLAAALEFLRESDPVVLAMLRGGVPVGYEIAKALNAPLIPWPAGKIGAPDHPEFALGAVGPGGVTVWNESALSHMNVPAGKLEALRLATIRRTEGQTAKWVRRRCDLAGRTVVLVDDGLATGLTLRAAIQAVLREGPGRVVVAVPVRPLGSGSNLGLRSPEDLVSIIEASPFMSVGSFYDDYRQVSDEEVTRLLDESRTRSQRHPPDPGR